MEERRPIGRTPRRDVRGLILTLFVVLIAFAGAPPRWLDGGGFPTPTPTNTLVPTETPTETPTVIPLEALFPTETPAPALPAPGDNAPQPGGLDAQSLAETEPSSPNLLLLAAPFVLALLVLAVIVGNWVRRSQT